MKMLQHIMIVCKCRQHYNRNDVAQKAALHLKTADNAATHQKIIYGYKVYIQWLVGKMLDKRKGSASMNVHTKIAE